MKKNQFQINLKVSKSRQYIKSYIKKIENFLGYKKDISFFLFDDFKILEKVLSVMSKGQLKLLKDPYFRHKNTIFMLDESAFQKKFNNDSFEFISYEAITEIYLKEYFSNFNQTIWSEKAFVKALSNFIINKKNKKIKFNKKLDLSKIVEFRDLEAQNQNLEECNYLGTLIFEEILFELDKSKTLNLLEDFKKLKDMEFDEIIFKNTGKSISEWQKKYLIPEKSEFLKEKTVQSRFPGYQTRD